MSQRDEDVLEPYRLDLRSADILEPRAQELAKLFPEAVRDGKIDCDALAAALGDVIDEGPERFGLTWPGKSDAIRMAQRPSEGTLVPMQEESVDWETTKNVIVEGENLEVLKVLQRSYHSRVKLIYIDPPYNTGKDFVYPDNFHDPLGEYLKASGQAGEDGGRLRANAETSGRYHSAWLSMMWPRLHLARSLLTDDGVIAVTIDSTEGARLRAVLDEIFGEENHLATIAWQRKYTRANDAEYFSPTYDSVLLFARDVAQLEAPLEPRTPKQDLAYRNPDSDPKGPWKATPLHAKSGSKARNFEVAFANGVKWTPPPGTYPRYSAERLTAMDEEGAIWFGSQGQAVPSRKTYLSEVKQGLTPTDFWTHEAAGSTHEGNSDLKRIGLEGAFSNPKPVKLMRRLLELFRVGADELVLDFFAGSGTMAEAVIRLNAADRSGRRFLLVQLDEALDGGPYSTISALTRARVRAADADVASSAERNGGFRAFRLERSAIDRPRLEMEELLLDVGASVSADRDDEALLAEVFLARGFELTTDLKWIDVEGVTAANVEDGALLACFARSLTSQQFEALVDRDPAQLILLEEAFGANDEVKINALQHLKTVNAHRETAIELLLL